MTEHSAILTPAPPHRGRTTVTTGAAVRRIVIPGRPQAKDRTSDGRLIDAAKTYMDNVRVAAGAALERPYDGLIRVDLHFLYTSPRHLQHTDWPHSSIPNADTAAALALRALVGVLVHHKSQINPLTITRTVLAPTECQAHHGDPHGATIITWET